MEELCSSPVVLPDDSLSYPNGPCSYTYLGTTVIFMGPFLGPRYVLFSHVHEFLGNLFKELFLLS